MNCPICNAQMVCPVHGAPAPVETGFELWVDVAYSDDGAIDYKGLKRMGVKGLVGKIGQWNWKDALWDKHAAGALDAGLALEGYWWSTPAYNHLQQVDILEKAIKPYPLQGLWVDVEQSHGQIAIWNKRHTRQLFSMGKFSSSQINTAALGIASVLDTLHTVPIGIYTRTSFILEFCPSMLLWLKQYRLWLSAYLNTHIYTIDKAYAEQKGFTYVTGWEDYLQHYASPPNSVLALPKGQQWDMWQFTGDRVKLQYTGSYMDLNYRRVLAQ